MTIVEAHTGSLQVERKFLNNPRLHRPYPWDLEYDKTRPWMLDDQLRFKSEYLGGVIIVVPEKYKTDFASIPRLFWRLFPKDGPWMQAAVVHDYLCDQRDPNITYRDAAEVFYEGLEELRVGRKTRRAFRRAVLTFGPRWP